MDLAYDQINQDAFGKKDDDNSNNNNNEGGSGDKSVPQASLNEDFQQAYKAFSNSPWGAKIGGFWWTAVKQVRAAPPIYLLVSPSHLTKDYTTGPIGIPGSIQRGRGTRTGCGQRL